MKTTNNIQMLAMTQNYTYKDTNSFRHTCQYISISI